MDAQQLENDKFVEFVSEVEELRRKFGFDAVSVIVEGVVGEDPDKPYITGGHTGKDNHIELMSAWWYGYQKTIHSEAVKQAIELGAVHKARTESIRNRSDCRA